MSVHTHKQHGWTRADDGTGAGRYTISPTDGSGDRVVMFMGAGDWANLPQDDRDRQDEDRVVLLSGDPLPAWAATWLDKANRRQKEIGRAAYQAAMDDADMYSGPFGRVHGDW